MPRKPTSNTVRRSVALSRRLVEDVRSVAPPDVRQNFNRLVTVALQEFAQRRKARAFEEAMSRMARDPAVQAECGKISEQFRVADGDGLGRD